MLRRHRLGIVTILLVVGFVYVAVPQLGFFDTNWSTLLQSDWRLFGISIAFLLVSFAAASVIYVALAPKPLRFWQTYIVQVAGAFAGKVLPAGLGSISLNYLYLRKRGCRQATAGTVVAVNNLLGFIGHGIWLLLVVVLLSDQAESLSWNIKPNNWLVPVGITGTVLAVVIFYTLRRRLRRTIHDVIHQLQTYRAKPLRLLAALAASMTLTACNILIVWLSAQSLDLSLGLLPAAVALTTGILAQTITPTPGGLGGVEAGLVAGLALGGLQLQDAIAVTILYRFVTYWLPLGFGGIALLAAVRRQLI